MLNKSSILSGICFGAFGVFLGLFLDIDLLHSWFTVNNIPTKFQLHIHVLAWEGVDDLRRTFESLLHADYSSISGSNNDDGSGVDASVSQQIHPPSITVHVRSSDQEVLQHRVNIVQSFCARWRKKFLSSLDGDELKFGCNFFVVDADTRRDEAWMGMGGKWYGDAGSSVSNGVNSGDWIDNGVRVLMIDDQHVVAPGYFHWLKLGWEKYGMASVLDGVRDDVEDDNGNEDDSDGEESVEDVKPKQKITLSDLAGITLNERKYIRPEVHDKRWPNYILNLTRSFKPTSLANEEIGKPYLSRFVGSSSGFSPHPQVWKEFVEWIGNIHSKVDWKSVIPPAFTATAMWEQRDYLDRIPWSWEQAWLWFCSEKAVEAGVRSPAGDGGGSPVLYTLHGVGGVASGDDRAEKLQKLFPSTRKLRRFDLFGDEVLDQTRIKKQDETMLNLAYLKDLEKKPLFPVNLLSSSPSSQSESSSNLKPSTSPTERRCPGGVFFAVYHKTGFWWSQGALEKFDQVLFWKDFGTLQNGTRARFDEGEWENAFYNGKTSSLVRMDPGALGFLAFVPFPGARRLEEEFDSGENGKIVNEDKDLFGSNPGWNPPDDACVIHMARRPVNQLISMYRYHKQLLTYTYEKWLISPLRCHLCDRDALRGVFSVCHHSCSVLDLLKTLPEREGMIAEAALWRMVLQTEIQNTLYWNSNNDFRNRVLQLSVEHLSSDYEGTMRCLLRFLGLWEDFSEGDGSSNGDDKDLIKQKPHIQALFKALSGLDVKKGGGLQAAPTRSGDWQQYRGSEQELNEYYRRQIIEGETGGSSTTTVNDIHSTSGKYDNSNLKNFLREHPVWGEQLKEVERRFDQIYQRQGRDFGCPLPDS